MVIYKTYKVEIKPNNRQKTLLNKTFGTARFVYNWGLAKRISLYKTEKKSTTAYTQQKELSAIKKKQFPWMYEVTKCAPREALKDLENAYSKFFAGLKEGKKVGFPRFKSKHRSKNSYRLSSGTFYVTRSTIKAPKIGQIKLKEKGYIPVENVRYISSTISKDALRYFASVQCEVEIPEKTEKKETVLGIDLGIKTLLTCSNGEIFANPKSTHKYEKKLAHAQKNFSRSKKGSHNRDKVILRVQKVHMKIKNSRTDNLHKVTSILVKTKPRYIVLEDLNVYGMLKNHSLAGAVTDSAFYEIKRQIQYKTSWYGGEVLEANRFYPSSKLCRKCGKIKEDLTLNDRAYVCECGHTEDRDLNAAINLENYGLSTLSSRGIKACGESVRLLGAHGL